MGVHCGAGLLLDSEHPQVVHHPGERPSTVKMSADRDGELPSAEPGRDEKAGRREGEQTNG